MGFTYEQDVEKDAQGETSPSTGNESALRSRRSKRGQARDIQRQLQDEGATPDLDDVEGRVINKPGIVAPEDGANLRDAPRPGDGSTVESHMPFGTRVFVGQEVPGGWYEVTHVDGRQGYIAANRVKTDLPEPGARLHRIGSGESAIGIAEGEYGQLVRPGQDLRFYVNVLEYVNRGEGDRGIYRAGGDDWEDTRTRAGYLIWLPSPTFAQTLEGIVDDGSITNGAWARAKEVASDVAEFALGIGGAVAGVLHGAAACLADILLGIADLVALAWDVLESIFTGSIIADIKALWAALSTLDWQALVEGWIDGFVAKWNHEDIFEKWHFRGWVVGYVLMEVALAFLSFGAVTGAKWVGKAAKAAKAIAALPRVQSVLKPIKTLKNVPDELLKALKGGKKPKTPDKPELPRDRSPDSERSPEHERAPESDSDQTHETHPPKSPRFTQREADDLMLSSEGRPGVTVKKNGDRPVGHSGDHVPPEGASVDEVKALAMSRSHKLNTTVYMDRAHAKRDLSKILNDNADALDALKPGQKLKLQGNSDNYRRGYNSVQGAEPDLVEWRDTFAVFERLDDDTLHLVTFSPIDFLPVVKN